MMRLTYKIMIKAVFFFIMIFFISCRGDIIPLDSDLSSYGWNYYENGEYTEALDWFTDAIKKDSSHFDAYNGVGWTMGELRQADSAIYYFERYLSRYPGDFDNILDFYAGLAFAYNALGEDGEARVYAQNYFFSNQNTEIGDLYWCFCHAYNGDDELHINEIDIRLILAISEYKLGNFKESQTNINSAYTALSSYLLSGQYDSEFTDYIDANNSGILDAGDSLFNGRWIDDGDWEYEEGETKKFDEFPLAIYDFDEGSVSVADSVNGRAYLAEHLAILQNKLDRTNGDNGLSCIEDNGQGGGYCQ